MTYPGVSPALAALLAIGVGSASSASPAEPAATPAAAIPAAPILPAASPPARPAVPPRLPTSAFAAQPLVRDSLLSPDGTALATRMTEKGQDIVSIFDLTGAGHGAAVSTPPGNDLVWFRWAGNGTILISVGKTVPWNDDQAYVTRLVAFDRASRKTRFIGGSQEGQVGDDLLWTDPQGQRILLSYQATIYDYPSVFSVDLASNHATEVVKQRDSIWHWSADEDGIVRYGYGYSDSHHWQAVYRKNAGDPFQVIAKRRDDCDEGADFDVLRITQGSDDGFIFDTDDKSGLKAIYKFNFATRKRGELVFEAPASDIEDAYTTEDGKTMASAWWTDDRPRVQWWDDTMKAFQTDLDKAVNGASIAGVAAGDRLARVISQSRDHTIKLVWLGAANDPGSIYLYRESTGTMQRIAKIAEALPPDQLATPRYVQYPARDGLPIHAYLTLPVGRDPHGLPLVILPHGGPFHVRDDGSYDEDVQFLANRGYVVLQPQFRGSGSFGTAFHNQGKGQWGRAMQDDIDDGMDWLVKQKIVDARRVCIVGISYGGYAALWGATRNPERYRCAASLAGVTDIAAQVRYSNHFDDNKHSREDWQQTVQGPKDFDLKTVSPLYTIDRLKVPVLVMHGDKDQRVLPKQSRLYADALKAAGKTFEYYSLPGDGHGYTTTAAAQSWYDRLDGFLAKYNPGD